MPASLMTLAPRVKETTTTTGTGPVTLAGAVAGYMPFAAVGSGTAVTVPYCIEWSSQSGADAECGIGSLNASGTVLTRSIVMGATPGTLRRSGSGGQANLPSGSKTVSLVHHDLFAVAATPNGYTADSASPTPLPPRAQGDSAVAVGVGALVDADYAMAVGSESAASGVAAVALGNLAIASGLGAVALGANAVAEHDSSVVVGAVPSMGVGSLTMLLDAGVVGKQVAKGAAVSGTPFAPSLMWLAQSGLMMLAELHAIGANAARTQWRVIRRRILISDVTIVSQGSDDVFLSTLGTVPTITCTIGGSPDAHGRLPLVVSATSSGATAVDWTLWISVEA